ncbi:MAG: UbiD family decarboxylase [Candidatus Binatia bacterium]
MTSSERPRVDYRDLRGYLRLLESAGLLQRIEAEVDLKYEIGAICVRSLDRRGPGLLFENIKGYKGMPLVSNIISTTEQLAIAFGTEADDLKIHEVIQTGKANPIPGRVVEAGPCQEEIHQEEGVDAYEFPTPWWHELDGGQYIGTTAGVITADPDTGFINMGMYRVMIKDRNTLAINARGPHPVGEAPLGPQSKGYGGHTHILKNESRGKSAPIAIAIGMDPLLTYAAGQGVPSDKLRHAEYAVAGGIRGEGVELVKCKTNDLLVPAFSEIVLEGEVLAGERTTEGPHGESQGFYGWNDQAFVMRVRCIAHRKNPINYGLICRCHEDYPKFMLSAGLRAKLAKIEHVKEVYVPEIGGGGMGLMAIIAVHVRSPAEIESIIEAIKGIPYESYTSHKPRWSILVDEDCDLTDWEDVMWRVAMGVMPDKDLRVGPRTDPITHEPLADLYASKASSVIIDATFRSKQGTIKGKEGFPPVDKVSKELMSKVAARWEEYGLK